MSSVHVFRSPTSAEVARVLACLFEKEVEFQLIRTGTYKGEQRRPYYLKLQGIERDEEEVQKSKKELEKVLDIYDKRLNEMNFLAGDKFTLADLAHLPNTHRLMTMVSECADMFKERPTVMKWWEAISGCPKWTRVVDL